MSRADRIATSYGGIHARRSSGGTDPGLAVRSGVRRCGWLPPDEDGSSKQTGGEDGDAGKNGDGGECEGKQRATGDADSGERT